MKASVIAIGTEILQNIIRNSNALWLREELIRLGFSIPVCLEVEDNPSVIKKSIDTALAVSDLVITTGGLGPTEDDYTREMVAEFFNLPLEFHPELIPEMEEKFKRRGIKMPEENKKQVYLPEKAVMVPNPTGTAPGFMVKNSNKVLVSLPGVPQEMKQMFENYVVPEIKKLFPETAEINAVIVRTVGIAESKLDEIMKTVHLPEHISYGTIAHYGQVDIRFLVKGKAEKDAIGDVKNIVENLPFKNDIFTIGTETLPEVLGKILKSKNMTCSTAESCTAGLTAKMITDVSGSSAYFVGGVASYSNDVKIKVLGVRKETIEKYGAVSEETAREMADGVKKLTGSDIAVSITGIAGPTGGTPEKPVGLVWFGVAYPDGKIHTEKHHFNGNREIIRTRASIKALELMWRAVKR